MSFEQDIIAAQKRMAKTGVPKIKNPRTVEEDGIVYLYDGDRLLGFMNAGQFKNLVKDLGE